MRSPSHIWGYSSLLTQCQAGRALAGSMTIAAHDPGAQKIAQQAPSSMKGWSRCRDKYSASQNLQSWAGCEMQSYVGACLLLLPSTTQKGQRVALLHNQQQFHQQALELRFSQALRAMKATVKTQERMKIGSQWIKEQRGEL